MWYRRRLGLVTPLILVLASTPAYSHHGGMGHHLPHHGGMGIGNSSSGLGFGYYNYAVGTAGGWGFAPQYMMVPPMILMPAPANAAPLAGPLPGKARMAVVVPRAKKKAEPAKAAGLVTIGDRLFRAGNVARSAQRYEQAAKADPDSAAPRVRLAQIALVRGQFAEAAQSLRAAITAEPNWLANAKDIQTIYAEPADFHKQISRLESHVLVEPGDRDAWLVLGAELYLSGQTRRASDIFVRLSDRKPDPTLAAFLDASNPVEETP